MARKLVVVLVTARVGAGTALTSVTRASAKTLAIMNGERTISESIFSLGGRQKYRYAVYRKTAKKYRLATLKNKDDDKNMSEVGRDDAVAEKPAREGCA